MVEARAPEAATLDSPPRREPEARPHAQAARVLALSSLDRRYGSTYRFRALAGLMQREGHDVRSVEGQGSAMRRLLDAARAAAGRYDLLFTQKFNPVTMTAMLVARARGKPVLVDWDDFDPGLQGSLPKRWLAEVCERIGPHLASCITTHSEPIRTRAEGMGLRTHVVPQGYDDDIFFPDAGRRAAARARFGFAPEHRVVGHLCTFTHGGTLDLPTILDAWQRVQRDDVRFLLIGGGPLEAEVRRSLGARGLFGRTVLTGLLPHDEVPDALRALDLSVVFMSDTPANRARVSFKVIEYLAVGVPVVGRVVGETHRLFGHLVQDADAAGLPSAIRRALAAPPTNTGSAARVPEDVRRFAWRNCRAPLASALEGALASFRPGAACA